MLPFGVVNTLSAYIVLASSLPDIDDLNFAYEHVVARIEECRSLAEKYGRHEMFEVRIRRYLRMLDDVEYLLREWSLPTAMCPYDVERIGLGCLFKEMIERYKEVLG